MRELGVVLSSGGLDSSTLLGYIVSKLGAENVISLSIHYGQKHDTELIATNNIANYYNVKHITIDLSTVFSFSNSSLMKGSTQEISHKSYKEQIDESGIVSTYIPFRNGLFLSTAASIAMSHLDTNQWDKATIYIGTHSDDSAGNAYPDCTTEFTDNMGNAIYLGTYNKVSIQAPFLTLHKKDIVTIGLNLGVPYELTYSCYEGHTLSCGKCATCLDRLRAFELNNVKDPIPYK